MTSIPRARLSHRAGKREAPFLGPDTGNAQARGIEVIRHGSRCAHLPTCHEDIAAAPRRKLLPVGTAQTRGRRMPLDEAMARNIAPGSTAGLPGLVLSAGLTTRGRGVLRCCLGRCCGPWPHRGASAVPAAALCPQAIASDAGRRLYLRNRLVDERNDSRAE